MSFWDTPWGHFPLIIFSWISAIFYFIMLFAIFRERKSLLLSSYIALFVGHSIADFLLFIQVEFLSRPRKFNWFNIFHEDMTGIAQYTFCNTAILRYALYVGHVVSAFNRYTVVKFPLVHKQIWRPFVTTIFVFSPWWTAVVFVLPGFFLYKNDIMFQRQNGSGSLLLLGGRFAEYDSCYGSFLACSSLLACFYFYSYTLWRLRTSTTTKRSEKKLFLCALFSFFPFFIGSVRGSFEFISSTFDIPSLWAIGNTLWYYDTELTFCSQVWINLLMIRQVKEAVLRVLRRQKANQNLQFSVEQSSRSKKAIAVTDSSSRIMNSMRK